ncbi:MAG: hypothetical protein K6G00_06015 [Treponema sp.]|nr:hypothetical protein [Treponema sp.]
MDVINDSEIEAKVQLDPAIKKQLVQYGIVSGLFLVLFALLLISTVTSRKSWEKGLKEVVASVYAENSEYEVREFEPISNPFSVSCAAFALSKKNDPSSYHAVIIRLQTIFGPVPAVYTYKDGAKEADFVTFVTLNKRIESTVVSNARYSQISYWGKRIPNILTKKDF